MKMTKSHRIPVANCEFSSNATEMKVRALFCLFSYSAGYLQKWDLCVLLCSYALSRELVQFLVFWIDFVYWMSEQDLGLWNGHTGISCSSPGDPGPLGHGKSSTLLCLWPLLVKCCCSLIALPATWLTGYSGQEKIALTSCDPGKVNHIGT